MYTHKISKNVKINNKLINCWNRLWKISLNDRTLKVVKDIIMQRQDTIEFTK